LRWLCKAISTQFSARFPSASREALISLIGGFILLRYINPAIISPEAFGIVHRKPTPTVRRNLTQIAKILQSIANG
jgi:Ras GTPase-activating-like protein IQGAP2/3